MSKDLPEYVGEKIDLFDSYRISLPSILRAIDITDDCPNRNRVDRVFVVYAPQDCYCIVKVVIFAPGREMASTRTFYLSDTSVPNPPVFGKDASISEESYVLRCMAREQLGLKPEELIRIILDHLPGNVVEASNVAQ